jgi:hypothetical protein
MAIRFASFEQYKHWLADPITGNATPQAIFLGASPRHCPLRKLKRRG